MNYFSKEENRLFSMIADSLTNTQNHITDAKVPADEEPDFHALIELAGHHAVLPMIYQQIVKEPGIAREDLDFLEMMTKQTAAEFYQILFNARNSVQLLMKNGIPVILLKGASVARFYPAAEARKSSDVDLFLVNPDDLAHAEKVLKAAGYHPMDEQHANHHVLWGTPDNHALELHTTLIEPTEDKKLNQYIRNRYTLPSEEMPEETILGISFPVFSDDLLAFHLLLHMLMDFLAAGFGLKLLCDCVVFWNRNVEPSLVKNFLQDIESCNLSNFLSAVTSACVRFLGLRADGSGTLAQKGEKLYCGDEAFCTLLPEAFTAEFMQDILDAERNGKPDSD
ncbi:MAG: nucleotidyltransferase family protein, partial [Lachnospiraceae bacterium]|nr:nucleotidyltransferase family protein [Lachnospiraceae bacterium]